MKSVVPFVPGRRAALGALAAGFGLACGVPARAAPATASPIRLAMIEGMSGPLGNGGAAVERNLRLAVETVNHAGGVRLPDGAHPFQLDVYDSQNGTARSLLLLRQALGERVPFILQGNSSAVASALAGALERHNARAPQARALFLNYSAVDPALTETDCSPWHFRFDAHAGMRMAALAHVIASDAKARRVYLLNQDYSFGHQVAQLARSEIGRQAGRQIVGEDFIGLGKVQDFAPYIEKIRASGADTVITGNWGNDLTLLVKTAREQGLPVRFYTFYANSLGAPAALGDAGVGRVLAVAEWHPNAEGAASDAFVAAFRRRFPSPAEDYPMLRMHVMIDMLKQAIEHAGGTDAAQVAHAFEGLSYDGPLARFHPAQMRAGDHQLMQPLYVMEMARQGSPGVRYDVEGSGFGFATVWKQSETDVQRSTPMRCAMKHF